MMQMATVISIANVENKKRFITYVGPHIIYFV